MYIYIYIYIYTYVYMYTYIYIYTYIYVYSINTLHSDNIQQAEDRAHGKGRYIHEDGSTYDGSGLSSAAARGKRLTRCAVCLSVLVSAVRVSPERKTRTTRKLVDTLCRRSKSLSPTPQSCLTVLYMCIYIYIYTHTCMYTHEHIHIYIYVYPDEKSTLAKVLKSTENEDA